MKIAIIGSGISGMAAAYYLANKHQVTLFEAGPRLGGHTATINLEDKGRKLAVDTGFIVFNDWTYPNFIELLNELKVTSQNTEMSFSVSDTLSGLEYAGTNLNTLFAQRKNILSAAHMRMLRDILRFNRGVEKHIQTSQSVSLMTLGAYLKAFNYSKRFIDYYIVPMGAAIWSCRQSDMLKMPLEFFCPLFPQSWVVEYS